MEGRKFKCCLSSARYKEMKCTYMKQRKCLIQDPGGKFITFTVHETLCHILYYSKALDSACSPFPGEHTGKAQVKAPVFQDCQDDWAGGTPAVLVGLQKFTWGVTKQQAHTEAQTKGKGEVQSRCSVLSTSCSIPWRTPAQATRWDVDIIGFGLARMGDVLLILGPQCLASYCFLLLFIFKSLTRLHLCSAKV